MSMTPNNFGRDIFFRTDKRIGTQACGTIPRVDRAHAARENGKEAVVLDKERFARALGRGGRFGQIKIGEHDMSSAVEEDVYDAY